jgi:hypothetical protein
MVENTAFRVLLVVFAIVLVVFAAWCWRQVTR